MSICYECQMDKIVSGCGVSVKDTKVVNGIGVVECKYFMELSGDLLKAQKNKNEMINNAKFK
ncbi:hypothetical protein FJQ98_16210 [Lysinibacillus agricola]|uniref:Uncharacterized protein n=1 Tax=Lysinibacillus agricola TaxID=2590012 RepID=A0ABX7ARC4_9BACI|nr:MULTISPECIES: hypothetical protein [Lysinibacillus]KOS61517.1 hypothetical protein AN161_18175 [Lysinibacillus sp. FJAT-14222]QQP10789.1 hypothetical protein FJQ98_16210 [Lysinibacillus agricola]